MAAHCLSTTIFVFQLPPPYSSIFDRGKGDDSRLGHGSEEHCRLPKVIEALREKDIINISLGSVHCLALTRAGKVYSWGGNDKGQLGISNCESKNIPTEVDINTGTSFQYVACGPAQVLYWLREFYIVSEIIEAKIFKCVMFWKKKYSKKENYFCISKSKFHNHLKGNTPSNFHIMFDT